MVNQAAQVSESDIMRHISQVQCRRQMNCKNAGNRQACVVCIHNRTGLHQYDNYREKISGMRFL